MKHDKPNRLVIIVDAYGPGKYYATSFKQKGVLCFHLQGTPEPLPRLTAVDISLFDGALVHYGNLEDTVAQIEQLVKTHDAQLLGILPGVEPGVTLADKLTAEFNIKSNGLTKALARRNKFFMAQEISKHNLPAPICFKSSQYEAIEQFVKSESLLPCVLKPLDSAGTNGVHICESIEQLHSAFHQVIDKENNMGLINEELLVQSYLEGDEYMVNSVSVNGQHFICDIWLAKKNRCDGFATTYDECVLIDSTSAQGSQISDYVKSVLDSLDISFGAAHTEVILTDKGPVIVETGARMSGLMDPEYNDACLGTNQVALVVESYLEPERFLQRINKPYEKKNEAVQLVLASPRKGSINDQSYNKIVDELETPTVL